MPGDSRKKRKVKRVGLSAATLNVGVMKGEESQPAECWGQCHQRVSDGGVIVVLGGKKRV